MEAPLKSSDGQGIAVTEEAAGVDVRCGPSLRTSVQLTGSGHACLGAPLPTSDNGMESPLP